jgi:D-serine deaminase-like pyridoxal phosphate-dependent protein
MTSGFEPGQPIEEIDTPVLLVDLDKLTQNIKLMEQITNAGNIPYRPHTKTHKSSRIAKMQLAAGARGVCCATISEAEAMAANGITDIHITSEIAGAGKIARILKLAAKTRLSLVVDHPDLIASLDRASREVGIDLGVLIEVDVGQGRCGIQPGADAARLAAQITNSLHLKFRGLQGYHGKLQMTPGFADRELRVRQALDLLQRTAENVRREGLAIDVMTGGGSGSLMADIKLHGLNELQPGSYVFMDSEYRSIEWPGAAHVPFENSLSILATVISLPSNDRAIIDAGLKAASMDHGPPVPCNLPAATFTFGGDEHGQLLFADGRCPLKIGDKVTLLPSHCDTTANLYDKYIVVRGGEAHDVWRLDARGHD